MKALAETFKGALVVAFVTAVVTSGLNGVVTWGVVQTKLDWIAKDAADAKVIANNAHARIDALYQNPPGRTPSAAELRELKAASDAAADRARAMSGRERL